MSRDREMAGSDRDATRRRALVSLLVVAAVATAVPLGAATVHGANVHSANVQPAGVHYVTDSGLDVTDASGGPLPNGSPFPDANTLALPGIALSANGTAAVTVDQRTGDETRLSGIDAAREIRVDPADKGAVVLGGGIDSLAFGTVADDASSSVTFAYTASESASLTFEDTGLSPGTTVTAVAGGGGELATATVADDGSLTFTDLPAGTHEAAASASETRTTATTTETSTAMTTERTATATPGDPTATAAPGDPTATATAPPGEPHSASTSAAATTPTGGSPGFGVLTALGALVATLSLVRKRR